MNEFMGNLVGSFLMPRSPALVCEVIWLPKRDVKGVLSLLPGGPSAFQTSTATNFMDSLLMDGKSVASRRSNIGGELALLVPRRVLATSLTLAWSLTRLVDFGSS